MSELLMLCHRFLQAEVQFQCSVKPRRRCFRGVTVDVPLAILELGAGPLFQMIIQKEEPWAGAYNRQA